MGLSLQELKQMLIAKKGYSISPRSDHLQDLKTLLNDMYQARSTPGVSCSGHSGSSYSGQMSLADMKSAGDQLKPCTCDSYNNTSGCNCVSRSGSSACSCYSRTNSCSCYSRSGSSSCDCNSRTGCSCVSRTEYMSCRCFSRAECNCDGFNAAASYEACSCNSRSGCSCQSRSGSSSCSCNSRDSGCSCQSRTGSSSCSCNGRCDCNAQRKFS